jgi:hypothetical protein
VESNMQNYYEEFYKRLDPKTQEALAKADPVAANSIMAPYMQDANYDVNVSNTTVPMEGRPGSLSSTDVPPTPSIPEIPDSSPTPLPVEPQKPQVEPPLQAPGASKTPSAGPNPLDTLLQASSTDQEARNKMLEDEKSKHLLGTIPVALGGIADAIGNAAVPYGGKGTSGAGEKAAAMLEKGETGRKAQFEENLKNDPNSQISAHYRTVLSMMMGTKVDDPKIKNLSAAQIATTLPEVEKYMAKQLGMEQLKASKDIALSEKQSQFDERRWERLGSAVNQLNAGSRKALGVAATANMRADRLLETARDPNVTPQDIQNMIADLQGVYKGGVPDQIMLQHGNYPSMVQELAKIQGIITNSPAAAKSPDIINRLVKVTREIKAVDNKVIGDNLGVNEVIFQELIQKDPARWESLKNRIMESTTTPSESAAKKEGIQVPTGMSQTIPTVSSQQEYDALPSGSQYKDANGKTYRKK